MFWFPLSGFALFYGSLTFLAVATYILLEIWNRIKERKKRG